MVTGGTVREDAANCGSEVTGGRQAKRLEADVELRAAAASVGHSGRETETVWRRSLDGRASGISSEQNCSKSGRPGWGFSKMMC